ncbi:MAG TPA: sialidase family protein [Candidatus Brocadiia bacterium]|nr:sialidase family protein [Candidatus Brocadiia bacterium]
MNEPVWSSCEVKAPAAKRDIIIYRREDYGANWPMTGGMWRFSDGEILVGFTRLRMDYAKPGVVNHLHLDTWGELCLVRSKDDGETWDMDGVQVVLRKREAAIDFFQERNQNQNWNPVDLASPDAILMSNYIAEHTWAKDYKECRFWPTIMASPDRGRTWPLGPVVKKPAHLFSGWGLPSYVVRPSGSVLLFSDCIVEGDEKPHIMRIFADILEDRATRWTYHGELPLERRDAKFLIHPAPVSLGDSSILLAVRAQTPAFVVYVMLYRSDDFGRNWRTVGRVTDVGGTPHLLRLRDGRIVLTYERRFPPRGIRARVSEDTQGARWGPELVLRDDGEQDIGYSRSVQRGDGSILTAYYFTRAAERIPGREPVRHIAGTIWRP